MLYTHKYRGRHKHRSNRIYINTYTHTHTLCLHPCALSRPRRGVTTGPTCWPTSWWSASSPRKERWPLWGTSRGSWRGPRPCWARGPRPCCRSTRRSSRHSCRSSHTKHTQSSVTFMWSSTAPADVDTLSGYWNNWLWITDIYLDFRFFSILCFCSYCTVTIGLLIH